MDHSNGVVTRRDFIRGTVGATLGASLLRPEWLQGKERGANPSRVVIVRDRDAIDGEHRARPAVLERMLRQTLTKLTGKETAGDAWRDLLAPGDVVGLVPTPHLNPTHDELVAAVRKTLIAAGFPEERIRNAQGGPEGPERCTALISMPALKGHWLTGIGTVIKNYIMFSGNSRGDHREDSAKLGEIWKLPSVEGKTKLVLVDALFPLCDKGPQPDPRYKWAYKGLIAGLDPVAVETVCLKIITAKREALKGEPWPLSPPPICVEAADKVYGLGTSRLSGIEIDTVGWNEDLLV